MNRKGAALVSLAPKGMLIAIPRSANGQPTKPIPCQRRTSSNVENEYPLKGGTTHGISIQQKRILKANDRPRRERS